MKFVFSEIPKFCISLRRSSDRRFAVRKEFKKHNIKGVEFFEAIDKNDVKVPELSVKSHESHANGILACAMSHLAVIKHAKENNLPAVCIFEDDVVFCGDFKERIKYLEGLPDFAFDIFCMGGHYPDRNDWDIHCSTPSNWKYIYKVIKMGGTYAYILTERAYDFIIRNWHFDKGIDQLYSDGVYRRLNTLAMTPFIAGHSRGKSEVTGADDWACENVNWHYQQAQMKELLPKVKIDLTDVTFIIPVRIESIDREFNFVRVIQHLCDNFHTTILIKEGDYQNHIVKHLLDEKIDRKGTHIEHFFEREEGAFHRTRHLNELLSRSKTPVTVNYDIDVMLLPEAYIYARDRIVQAGVDLVYPYRNDPTDAQIRIDFPDKHDYTTDLFDPKYHSPWGSKCGHVQFFKTSSYIAGGMENEAFVAYAPEDAERMERFIKMGYRVEWSPFQVMHIEHSRTINSTAANPHFSDGQALYNKLLGMGKEELLRYYREQEYLKKYH